MTAYSSHPEQPREQPVPMTRNRSLSDAGVQRMLLWGAVFGYVVFALGWVVFARLVPPPSPSESARGIASFWAHSPGLKRLGVTCLFGGTAFMLPFFLVIFQQMRRVDTTAASLANLQLFAGALSIVPVVVSYLAWSVLAYRPDQYGPEFVRALNDLGWFGFFYPWLGIVQLVAIAVCAFRDAESRVFPRWVGYFNLWVAVSFVCGSLVIFFKRGPVAWNGVIAFWIAFALFAAWIVVMLWLMFRATGEQLREETGP